VNPIETILLQVVLSLLVAATTAFLTVWLSLRRFYREKWWEAKMRAYTEVIQALHHMKWHLDISVRAEMQGRDTDTDYHKEWGAKHRAAWVEINKQVDIGEFLYSPASVQLLQTLINDTKSGPDDMYIDHLIRLQTAVNECLPKIKAAARTDLGLPPVR
jgi:hypothetical protein